MKSTNKKLMDGYKLTLEKVKELETLGYTVEIKSASSSFGDDVKLKYNSENNLPSEMWKHIGISIDDSHSIEKVFDIQSELIEVGIGFDTGFGGGVRDWEIDWSFSVE